MTTINLPSITHLPKENIPQFKKNTDCVSIDKIHYIFHYNEFKKQIFNPYKIFFKLEFVKKFENTCHHMFKKVGFGIFVFVFNGKIHTYQVFANTTELKPGSNKITKKHL